MTHTSESLRAENPEATSETAYASANATGTSSIAQGPAFVKGLNSPSPPLDVALWHLAQGRSIIPICPASKTPYARFKWTPYQTRRPTEAEVRKWWARWPDAMVGIVTGELSGIVGLDVDGERGLRSLKDRRLHLPETVTVNSPGGRSHFHCLFQYPNNGHRIGSPTLLPKVHLRGEPGILIAAGSVRADGKRYTFADGLGPDDVDLAPCPDWIEKLLSRNGKRPRKQNPAAAASPAIPAGREARDEYSFLAYPAPVPGRDLGALCGRMEFVKAAAAALGIPGAGVENIGQGFSCVLPGHKDVHPSASLYRRADGKVVYHDWHAASGEEWYGLADVYAARSTGKVEKLGAAQLLVWTARLLIQTGFLKPAPVDMPPLPAGAGPAVRKVYDGFKLLLACKWLIHGKGAPTAFSWRFAAAWCGLSERHAGGAMRGLLQGGCVQATGSMHCGGRSLLLFAPGTAAMVQARAGRTFRALAPDREEVKSAPIAAMDRGQNAVTGKPATGTAQVLSDPLADLAPEVQERIRRGLRVEGMDDDSWTAYRRALWESQREQLLAGAGRGG